MANCTAYCRITYQGLAAAVAAVTAVIVCWWQECLLTSAAVPCYRSSAPSSLSMPDLVAAIGVLQLAEN